MAWYTVLIVFAELALNIMQCVPLTYQIYEQLKGLLTSKKT